MVIIVLSSGTTVVVFTVILQLAFFLLPSLTVAVIVAVPFLTAFITPLEVTIATDLLLLVQATALLFALLGDTTAFKV